MGAHETAVRQLVLLTTSRNPTRKMRSFCQDLTRSIPKVIRINRGKLNLDRIAERALSLDADRVIIVDRWKGGPGKIKLFRTKPTGLTFVPPLMYVAGIKLQREFKETAKPIRSLVVTASSKSSAQVVRIAEFLSSFLKIPMSSIDEARSKFEASMYVSVDTSRNIQITYMLLPQVIETGPRIKISRIVWEI